VTAPYATRDVGLVQEKQAGTRADGGDQADSSRLKADATAAAQRSPQAAEKSGTVAGDTRLVKAQGASQPRLDAKSGVQPEGQVPGPAPVPNVPGAAAMAPKMPPNLGGPGKLAPAGSGAAQTPEAAKGSQSQGADPSVPMTRTLGAGAEGPAPLATIQQSTSGPTTATGVLEVQEKSATFAADPSAFPRGAVGGSGPDALTVRPEWRDSRLAGVVVTTDRTDARIKKIQEELDGRTLTGPQRDQRLDELAKLWAEQDKQTRDYLETQTARGLKTLDEAAAEAEKGHYDRLQQAAFLAKELAEQTGSAKDIANANKIRATYDAFLHAASADARLNDADGALSEAEKQDGIANNPGYTSTIQGNAAARREQALDNAESACRAAATDAYKAKQAARDSGSAAAKRRANKAEKAARKKWKKLNKLRKKAGRDPLPYPEPPAPEAGPPPAKAPPPVPLMPDALFATPGPDDGEEAASVAGGEGETPDVGNGPETGPAVGGGGDPCAGCKCDPPCPAPSACTCLPRPPPDNPPLPLPVGPVKGDQEPPVLPPWLPPKEAHRGKHSQGGAGTSVQTKEETVGGSAQGPIAPPGVLLRPDGSSGAEGRAGPVQPQGSAPHSGVDQRSPEAPQPIAEAGTAGPIASDAWIAVEQRRRDILRDIAQLRAWASAIRKRLAELEGGDIDEFKDDIRALSNWLDFVDRRLERLEKENTAVVGASQPTPPGAIREIPVTASQMRYLEFLLELVKQDMERMGLPGLTVTFNGDGTGKTVTFKDRFGLTRFKEYLKALGVDSTGPVVAIATESGDAVAAEELADVEARVDLVRQVLQLCFVWSMFIAMGVWRPPRYSVTRPYLEANTTKTAHERGLQVENLIVALVKAYDSGLDTWRPGETARAIEDLFRSYNTEASELQKRGWGVAAVSIGLTLAGFVGASEAVVVEGGAGAVLTDVGIVALGRGALVALDAAALLRGLNVAAIGIDLAMFAVESGGGEPGPVEPPGSRTPQGHKYNEHALKRRAEDPGHRVPDRVVDETIDPQYLVRTDASGSKVYNNPGKNVTVCVDRDGEIFMTRYGRPRKS